MNENRGARLWRNKIRITVIAAVLLATIVVVGLSVAGSKPKEAAPTINTDYIRTEAVGTFSANLTLTPNLTSTPGAVDAGLSTATARGTGSVSPTPLCHGLRFVRDVSIPDNTGMRPAQVFTKSWLVENIGTCPWQSGYQVVLIGGVAMGGSPFKVLQDVGPGGQIQVSIKMVAPTNQTGTVEGTWKMSDEKGGTFGDFMSVIIVVASPTGTPRVASATGTP